MFYMRGDPPLVSLRGGGFPEEGQAALLTCRFLRRDGFRLFLLTMY